MLFSLPHFVGPVPALKFSSDFTAIVCTYLTRQPTHNRRYVSAADASSPLAKTLSRVFSNENGVVVVFDDLALSPLTSTLDEASLHDAVLRDQKNALDRSMSREAAKMDEWRGTMHVKLPGESPTPSSTTRASLTLPPARSPLIRSNSHPRGWITEEAANLPHMPRPGTLAPAAADDGALLDQRQRMQYNINDLPMGQCSIKEDELPEDSPLSCRDSPAPVPAPAPETHDMDCTHDDTANADTETEESNNNNQQRPRRPPPQHAQQPRRTDPNNEPKRDDEPDEAPPTHNPNPHSMLDEDGYLRDPEEGTVWKRVVRTGRFGRTVSTMVEVMSETAKRVRQPGPTYSRSRGGNKGQKKRRVVIKDPNKPKPKPWTETELEHFRHLLKTEGPNDWNGKAAKLGTGRTAKSLHTRWLRDEGRIVDRPRGMAAMREQAKARGR